MKNKSISIIIGAIAIFIWATVMVYFYASDRVDVYLSKVGFFHPLLILGGLGLGVLSVFNIVFSGRDDDGFCGHDHEHGHHHEHDHDHEHEESYGERPEQLHAHGSPSGLVTSVLVLIIPVVAAAIFTPDAKSANFVTNNRSLVDPNAKQSNLSRKMREDAMRSDKGKNDPISSPNEVAVVNDDDSNWEFTREDLDRMLEKNSDGAYLISIGDLFYTGGDEEIQRVLDGVKVESTAQVLPETINNAEGKRILAVEMSMTCCAADLRPMSVPVEFSNRLPDYKEMGWYKIFGTVAFEKSSLSHGRPDLKTPFLKDVRIERTDPRPAY